MARSSTFTITSFTFRPPGHGPGRIDLDHLGADHAVTAAGRDADCTWTLSTGMFALAVALDLLGVSAWPG